MSAVNFEITTLWGDAFLAETSEAARRAACLAVFAFVSGNQLLSEEAYDALTRQEQFALWRMLEGMGARMRRIPVGTP